MRSRSRRSPGICTYPASVSRSPLLLPSRSPSSSTSTAATPIPKGCSNSGRRAGWGSVDQITNPRLATLAFFGRAQHTANTGLLDLRWWQQMDLATAAQAVQISRYPDSYAAWEDVAGRIADVLGRNRPTQSKRRTTSALAPPASSALQRRHPEPSRRRPHRRSARGWHIQPRVSPPGPDDSRTPCKPSAIAESLSRESKRSTARRRAPSVRPTPASGGCGPRVETPRTASSGTPPSGR